MRVRGHRPFEPESCLVGPELLHSAKKTCCNNVAVNDSGCCESADQVNGF